MPQQCAEPPPRPPPTGAKQGHNPPTTPPPQPDSPGKPPKPHPPNPTHPRGSSPHTRGARPTNSSRRRSCRDHPRIRGEHFLWWWSLSEGVGSSPHTRGAQDAVPRRSLLRGIIPAYAGSTPGCGICPTSRRDHPRIRGEHPLRRGARGRTGGSSPHTRGARWVWTANGIGEGIIPAYAGSTRDGASWTGRRKDHPRIRGEHRRQLTETSSPYGSSPHTRGARRGLAGRRRFLGIIPAYAGSTRN